MTWSLKNNIYVYLKCFPIENVHTI